MSLALGIPVGELKARVTQDEVNLWVAYIEENGPLNLALRVESAVARAVAPFLKDAKPRDLMPWPREREPEMSTEDMAAALMAQFSALARETEKNRKVG